MSAALGVVETRGYARTAGEVVLAPRRRGLKHVARRPDRAAAPAFGWEQI